MTMSLRDKIIEDYKIMLAIGWCEADEDGNVSVVLGDTKIPATIDGKRVILPTREQMKDRNWENRLGFHPLREAFNQGVSDVLANMRTQFVNRFNTSISYLMQEFISIAKNTAGQKDLTTEQSQVLSALTQCNENTDKAFKQLQKNTGLSDETKKFINIFVKKGGVVANLTYGRAAIVTFPIYEALVAGDEKINNVKISGKDREMFIKLFRFIFPDIETPEAYNIGVNAKTAPFMESLMRASIKIAEELVDVSKPYMNLFEIPYIMEFPSDMKVWIEIFDDPSLADRMAHSIPNLVGTNVAELDDKKADSRREAVAAAVTVKEAVRESERHVEEAPVVAAPIVGRRATMAEMRGGGLPPPVPVQAPSNPRAVVVNPEKRLVTSSQDIDRERERQRAAEAEKERIERQRRDEEDRIIRQRRRDEDDRLERERRDRERDRDRDDRDRRDRGRDDRDRDRGGRDYDRRDDRDRDRDRSRDDDRRTGDAFDDNPVLRDALRDEEDRGGRGRGRDRGGRGRGGVRDIRHGDRDYDDRDDYYDRDDRRSRRR